jgi:4-hydroxybenzoate polyprenyltransferase
MKSVETHLIGPGFRRTGDRSAAVVVEIWVWLQCSSHLQRGRVGVRQIYGLSLVLVAAGVGLLFVLVLLVMVMVVAVGAVGECCVV